MDVVGAAVADGDAHVAVAPEHVARAGFGDRDDLPGRVMLSLALMRNVHADLAIRPCHQAGAVERVRAFRPPFVGAPMRLMA